MNNAWRRLHAWFAAQPQDQRYMVAASGGVDSTLVAVAAMRFAPGAPPGLSQARIMARVTALTADTPLLPSWEKSALGPLFQTLGIHHGFVHLDLLADPRIAANQPDRCYHCKHAVMGALISAAGPGCKVLDGTVADDDPERPGMPALQERGIRSPLLESNVTKEDVRALARELGLPNADKPSDSCLASRITGPINWERLNIVEGLEKVVRKLGISDCRVRYDDLTITIETLKKDRQILDTNQTTITTAINDLGIPVYRWRERYR